MVQVYVPGNENFTANGDATLFCYNCDLIANLGGSWVLDVTVPIDQEGRWKYLTEESVLKVDTWQEDKQLYRVAKVEKTESSISATAYPVFFDSANDAFLLDCRPTGKTGQQALDIMCAGTPYSGESNIGTIATAYFVRRNLMDAINGSASPTFIERWGGEILYDNYKVIINDRVGGDYGVEARYGRNIAGVVYAVDTAEIVTRIVPIAYNGYMMSGKTPWVDSGNVDKFAKVYTREVRYENIRMAQDAGGDEDVISCANQAELDAALRAAAEADFAKGIDAPKVTIDIDMLAVQDMASRYEDALRDAAGDEVHDTNDLQIITTWYRDYASLEVVRLGDTIRCRHSKLDITTTARVVSITWDCVRGKVTHIVLGDYKYDYIRTVNGAINRISNAVREDGTIIAERVQGFLDGAQTQLRIQNSVADRVNTMAILFEDLDPDSPLYGALGIGTQGICISKTRTADGRDWDWTTGITANGMNASMGVFGILADKLGKNWINLDTGEISLGSDSLIGGKTIAQYMDESDQALVDYATQNDQRVTDLENRIDGQYDTYFEDYTPTLSNYPASDWTTEALKADHEGDLFYNKADGNSYRFFKNNGVWEWTLITDTVAAQALALASEAKDTADGKRRVFTAQPEPPYDAGDIYFTGTEILVCVNPKTTGSFASSDFVRKDAYNSQASFDNFVTTYNQTISGLQQDINDRIETWPQADDPSDTWDTTQDHTGDIWYDGDSLYYWDGSAWQEMSAAPTAEVAESLSKKAQIFISQPTVPYHKGDLWFDSTEVGSADILTCIKDSGTAFLASDWRKCNKYIDDAELGELRDDLTEITNDLQVQLDGKIETFRQATDPSLDWGALTEDVLLDTSGNEIIDSTDNTITTSYERIKRLHEGDLWHRTTDNTEWRYHNGVWEPMDVPDSLWSEVNSKRQIFVSQPTPPYAVGDLWYTGTVVLVCTKDSGSAFAQSDWSKKDFYTDDSSLEAFISGAFADLTNVALAKIETWTGETDPSASWTDKSEHEGDLWYNSTGMHRWTGAEWTDVKSEPTAAMTEVINNKANIYTGVTTPKDPKEGDLWFKGADQGIQTYVDGQWKEYNKYTDDSGLTEWISTEYAADIMALTDGKIETYRQNADPSTDWAADTKATHTGDIWQDTNNGKFYRYNGTSWDEMTATPPGAIMDVIDGKAQVFSAQPEPPYYKNDLWYTGTVIKVCIKDSGASFAESDWVKKDYYTDDSALDAFLTGDYADTISQIHEQVDGKIETWYQSSDPSVNWTGKDKDVPLLDSAGADLLDTNGNQITTDYLKMAYEHLGDIWHNTNDNTQWRWSGGGWEEITVPDALIDKVDSKAQVFVGTATPQGAQERDLWFKGPEQGIYTLVGGQWEEYNKYTSDENLEFFVTATYEPTVQDLQEQIDGKIELWFYPYVPTLNNIPAVDWNTEQKSTHVGDLFYDTTSGKEASYRFEYDQTGKIYRWVRINDANITKALSDASKAQDTADKKRRIFTTQPEPPYDKGDLWTQGANGDIRVCNNSRATGNYSSADWNLASRYTGDAEMQSWLQSTYEPNLTSITTQLDKKIETFSQTVDPALQWEPAERLEHVGDLWYRTTDGIYLRYTGSAWSEITATPPASVQKTISDKRKVYVGTELPAVPYDVGDIWMYTGDPQEMRYCTKASATTPKTSDWQATPTEVKTQATLQALNGEIIAKVVAGDIINAINLSAEGTKIDASKLTVNSTNIDINGVVSANNYFKVNLDGSMEATKGKFGLINIDADKVYSTGHDTATSATAGFLLHSDGTVSVGDAANYLRFVKDAKTGAWGLKIALDDAAKLIIGNSEAATKENLKSVADTAKSNSDEAAKTATNFLYYDNATGLVISQNGTANGATIDETTGQTVKPYNTQILGDGIYFREALKVLSKISGSGMTIYRPGANLVKKMDLVENGLYFYRNDGTTEVASYTDAGFNVLMGTIGKGDNAFTIDDRSIHNGTLGASNSVFISTGSSTDASIAGSPVLSGWALVLGENFGATRNGALYAKSVTIEGMLTAAGGSKIGAWTITDGSLTNGGMSIGSSGIRIGDAFSVSSSGTVNGSDAHFTGNSTFGGKLSAATGSFSGELTSAVIKSVTGILGGWTIADRKLHSGNIFLQPGGQSEDDAAVTICGREAKDWVIGAGSNFGVTSSGALFSKSGQIAGFEISGKELSSKAGVYTAYMRSGSSASTKAFEAVEQQDGAQPITHFSVTYGGKLYTDTADLGGITLADGAIYANNHKTYNSSNAGFLLNKDGVFSVGNSTNYVRFYEKDGVWKLDIRASTLTFGGSTPVATSELSNYATKTSVDSLVGRIDDVDSDATDALKEAGKANTAAGNAQTTANNAATAASTAQTTANKAGTAASNAQTTANNAATAASNAATAASNAAKTATNYLYVDNTGLHVSSSGSGYTSGKNIGISSTAITFNSGTTALASFAPDGLTFYKNGKVVVDYGQDAVFYDPAGSEAIRIDANGIYCQDPKGKGKLQIYNGDITISGYNGKSKYDAFYASTTEVGIKTINGEKAIYCDVNSGAARVHLANTSVSGDASVTGSLDISSATGMRGISIKLYKNNKFTAGEETFSANASSLNATVPFTITKKMYMHGGAELTGASKVTLSNPGILCFGSDGKTIAFGYYAGSSKRFKDIERNTESFDVEKFYNVKPVIASYKTDYLDKSDAWQGVKMPMLIAEDIEAIYPKAVKYDRDGIVQDYSDHLVVAVHQQMLIDLRNEIKNLKAEIARLKATV